MQDVHDGEGQVQRLLDEEKLTMAAAAKALGTTEGRDSPIHPSTVVRWCTRGVRLAGGRVVKLEHLRLGGRLLTTRQALARFVAAQTETAGETPTVRTPTQRQRAADRAAAELEKMGA